MSLVDPVYTGIPLGDPANICRVHWNTTGKMLLKQSHTEMPLEKFWWFSPTLGHHWKILVETAQHTQTRIVKQRSIHASLKWQDGGTAIIKWTGLCKFSFYLEFTTQQWIPVLILKHVSTSTSSCAWVWYKHHYSFCVLGVAVQMKSVELKQPSPYQLYE